MKTRLLLLIALMFGLTLQAQNYQLTLIQNNNYNFSVAAVPDFNSTAPHPYINDQNFTVLLPDNVTISNVTGGYSVPVFTSLPAPNTAEDAIAFNLVQDVVLPAHTAGTPIILTTFDVDGSPTSGSITLLDNTSSLAMAAPSIFNSFFIGTLSGNLVDTATDNYVGQMGTTTYEFFTLGTVENELTGYSIFPNPAKDVVTIKGLENNLKSVEIYNISGQKVMTAVNNLETINISKLQSGVYFVKLSTEEANTTIKLIKKG
ncbi:T9SS type A sorting domain-containing protein [uncultured Lacinutrix sp.]|uniref:T9SS type A sorting domain-containing protein n=1 Tax=uncultured Lacinutrix sp. TaxID=574032 RepID=UPI002629101F|nr:T9SS type A sorting domain-containing protein [uncultured Lacinutrix sp.]